jgi:hypothetical protein
MSQSPSTTSPTSCIVGCRCRASSLQAAKMRTRQDDAKSRVRNRGLTQQPRAEVDWLGSAPATLAEAPLVAVLLLAAGAGLLGPSPSSSSSSSVLSCARAWAASAWVGLQQDTCMSGDALLLALSNHGELLEMRAAARCVQQCGVHDTRAAWAMLMLENQLAAWAMLMPENQRVPWISRLCSSLGQAGAAHLLAELPLACTTPPSMAIQ